LQDALNKIGGIQVLFPLLEKIPADLDVDLSLISPTGGTSLPPVVMTTYSGREEAVQHVGTNLGDWEMVCARDEIDGDAESGGKSKHQTFSNTVDAYFGNCKHLHLTVGVLY
jgi:hypothetical protein